MHVNLDPQLVDKIANEVKSQGVFDQFRKDSMADVDTKPAYQNLRQRVENTVNKFLSEQKWTADLNKNQLREKLRKHITEAGFLDVGVERIVDQVVNPKIATVFQPKIEDIAYKYLGIPKPEPKIEATDEPRLNGMLRIETDLMPTDLEQVSPDSDKGTVKSDYKEDMETDDKMDDFESPPFEPIEVSNNRDLEKKTDEEDYKPDIVEQKPEISSLVGEYEIKEEIVTEDISAREKLETSIPIKMEEVEANISCDVTQESQLSQVSSDSRLSIVTNDNTQDEQSTACAVEKENHVNISEEAQMPKFNENSNSGSDKKPSEPLHFDIKKDEIKFEGTERKTEPPIEAMSPNTSDDHPPDSSIDEKLVIISNSHGIPLPPHEFSFEKENEFSFSKIEIKVEIEEATKTTSLEDSADRELHIFEKSELSQGSMSQHSIESPMAKQEKLLKSPSATSSPSQPQKSSHRDKEHSSSSSRHKKHSRDKRSDRDKDKHSSGYKASSSSSSKYHYSSKSSGSHRVSGTSSDHHHHHHRSSSSSAHKSKHSVRNGKSSRSHNDSKDSRSRDHSKSNSDKAKDKSKDKSDRSKPRDDHYSSKQKWRKSSDSNDDEDSSQEGIRSSGLKDSRDNATNGTHNNSNTSSVTTTTNNPTETVGNTDTQTSTHMVGQKIIILDNVLENPTTNFIEIGETQVQVNSQINQASNCAYDGESLYYFESEIRDKQDVDRRVKIITEIMEDFRKILRKNVNLPQQISITDSEDCINNPDENSRSRPESVSPTGSGFKRRMESPNTSPSFTSATLTIDCVSYGTATSSPSLSKRFKFNGTSLTKISPTPSELSVNSKENEFVDKNAQSDSDSLGSRDNTKSVIEKEVSVKRRTNVIRNQRYSSEDLYKPRPILSQRSRRRGLDAVT